MRRNDLSEGEALARINSQIPQEEKLNKADYIIYNNSDLGSLKIQTDNVIRELIKYSL